MPITIGLLAYANNIFGGAIMPGRNGTGPEGNGSLTGRGLGNCSVTSDNTNTNANVGVGTGRGRGGMPRGGGRGMGRAPGRGMRGGFGRGFGRGLGYGQGQGFNQNNPNVPQNVAANREEASNTNPEKIVVDVVKETPTTEVVEIEKIPETLDKE